MRTHRKSLPRLTQEITDTEKKSDWNSDRSTKVSRQISKDVKRRAGLFFRSKKSVAYL